MINFIKKMRGVTKSPPRAKLAEIAVSWMGGFSGIFLVGYLGTVIHIEAPDILFLIGSFGASAVLLYGAPTVTFAQPRNLIGGHIVSALVGVMVFSLVKEPIYFSAALAVATAIAAMHLTRTLHPPGGATALIAVIGGARVHELGFIYVVAPVALGAIVMLAVALLVNNIFENRSYPQFWW
jgi:CBS-domain-containing membrane protein